MLTILGVSIACFEVGDEVGKPIGEHSREENKQSKRTPVYPTLALFGILIRS